MRFKTYLNEIQAKPSQISVFQHATKNINKVLNTDFEDEWVYTARDLIKSYGFNEIGDGKYGHVFGHPRYKYIVKIFMKDTAYLKYLDFAKRNQRNKYVPQIRGKVVKLTGYMMAVRLEKLLPHYTFNSQTMVMKWLEDQANKHNDKDAKELLEFFNKNKNILDLHGGNVMQRRNGQVVFIDPFYNWYKKEEGGFTIDPEDVSKFRSIFVK